MTKYLTNITLYCYYSIIINIISLSKNSKEQKHLIKQNLQRKLSHYIIINMFQKLEQNKPKPLM